MTVVSPEHSSLEAQVPADAVKLQSALVVHVPSGLTGEV